MIVTMKLHVLKSSRDEFLKMINHIQLYIRDT